MILDRWYQPDDNELIYHYCKPESFIEIVRNRNIWLSASHTMNDSTERSWGYSIFSQAVNLIREECGDDFLKEAAKPIAAGQLWSILMIASFSLDADVLSQWRAYGDDGRGFAVGFNASEMRRVPARQLRVLYDVKAQVEELANNLRQVFKIEKEKGFTYDEEYRSHMAALGLDLCAYKHPGFHEEREIRVVHASGINPDEKAIIGLGAINQKGERMSGPLEIRFRIVQGGIVPSRCNGPSVDLLVYQDGNRRR
jgi:hypothetical protein